MNDKSDTPRPRRSTSTGHKTSQFDTFKIGGKGPIPDSRKSRSDYLLEIGRTRGVPCVIDQSGVNAVFVRRILIHKTGKIVNAVFAYPITEDADFDEGKAWMDRFWPIAGGQIDE